MSLSRRKTLALIGGGAILAATAGTGSVLTRKPTTALAPWAQAGQYAEPRMRALSYALLAPNPHNRQPWKVDLSSPDTVVLYVDTDRLLPHTDPYSRQIIIGLGCFLEVLRMAALEDGFAVEMDLFPEGMQDDVLDARPVAVCTFAPTQAPADPLFQQVPHRRTLKEVYDTTHPVEPAHVAALTDAVKYFPLFHTTDMAQVQELRDLSQAAMAVEFETPRTYKESVDLFRIGAREVNANPDGLDFTGPMFEALRLTGLFSRKAAMDPDGMSKQQGLDMTAANMQSAMGHIWQVTPGNARTEQIQAGMDWVRLNLAATSVGLGMQPLSQALQEYPEMDTLYAKAHGLLAPDGGVVQMWARIGYGPNVPQSPRWPLEAKLIDV